VKPRLRIPVKTWRGCQWSNGSPLSHGERERLSIMLGSGRVPLLPGESPGLWFVRVRKVLETALFNPRVALGSKDREGAPS
jgi:hypothetical protein